MDLFSKSARKQETCSLGSPPNLPPEDAIPLSERSRHRSAPPTAPPETEDLSSREPLARSPRTRSPFEKMADAADTNTPSMAQQLSGPAVRQLLLSLIGGQAAGCGLAASENASICESLPDAQSQNGQKRSPLQGTSQGKDQPPKKVKNGGYSEWTDPETKVLLDYYENYFPQIGPLKKFKNKKAVFAQISKDILTTVGTAKTPEQCNTRLKTIQKRKRQAVCHNNRSGAGPVDVPFEDELDRIRWLDDSIEPEVVRDVNGATFKTPPSSSQTGPAKATATAAAADTAVASTSSAGSPDESPDPMEASERTASRSGRTNSARMQHMKEFFAEMGKLEEAREKRKEERHRAKREQKDEIRHERKERHEEKMRFLAQILAQPQTKN